MLERLEKWAIRLQLGPAMFAGTVAGGLVALGLYLVQAWLRVGCQTSLCEAVSELPGQGVFLSGVIAGGLLSVAFGASVSFAGMRASILYGLVGMVAAGPLPALWMEAASSDEDQGTLAFISGVTVLLVWVLVPTFDRLFVHMLTPTDARSSVLTLIVAALAAMLLIVEPNATGATFFLALASVSTVGLITVGASRGPATALRAFRVTTAIAALVGVAGWWILVT